MRVRFSALAKQEFSEARDWYERQQRGLGGTYAGAIRESVRQIAQMPRMFPIELADVRRCVVRGYPYVLRYVIRSEFVLIVAVSHQRRDPDYWTDRL